MHYSKDDKIIRTIEKEIDKYYSSLFKYNKTSLIKMTLRWVQSLIYASKIEESNNPLSTMLYLNRYINATNIIFEGIINFSNSDNNMDFDIEYIFFNCEKYSKIYDAYVAYSRGFFDATYDEVTQTIIFNFNNETELSKKIFISDLLEIMFYKAAATTSEMKRTKEESLKKLNSKNIQIPLVNTMNNKHDENEYSDKIDELFSDIMHETVARHFETQTQVPTDWNLIGISMDEFKVGWCAISRLALKKTCLSFIHFNKRFKNNHDVLMKYKKKDLLLIIQDHALPMDKALKILQLLTHDELLNNNNIRYQPLICINDEEYIFAPSFFVEFIPQDNFIAIVNKINNKLYNQLSNQKEDIMIEELDQQFKNKENILIDSKLPLPNNLPDIDYFIYDQNSNIAFVVELKFLLKAHNLKEKLTRDEEIHRGVEQVLEYKDYVSSNINKLINRQFGIDTSESSIRTCFFLISKNGIYSGNYNYEVPVISLFRFKGLLAYSFETLYDIISNRSYLPQPKIDYEEDSDTFEFGGYNFSMPLLKPIIVSEVNEYLLYDKKIPTKRRKIGRNSPCPCGSGKKFKKCCGK